MTSINSEKSKRIAKNTVVLYIRMIVVMLVALYTSRVILKALGVEDYGLYNVVGGVVSLFSFLRSSMEKATQRFLNVEMARGEVGDLTKVFCVSVTIHIVIVALVLLLTETIGLWFLNNYIQIPVGREMAANWVYQATVFSLCFTILSVPYSADIIAHEKMSFYAIVSVLDAFLKLAIAFLVMHDDGDRLILYGFLMMGVSIVNWFLYAIYCRRKYVETRFRFLFDKSLFKEMFSFTGWTLLGQAAIIGTNQGNSILVNVFHSVTANAAMSIGSQVNGAVVSLSANFQTAFNPQITQSYAEGDRGYLKFLIVTTSKLSFFLLFIVSMPIVFNINTLLDIWLDVVPDGAAIFCIYTLAGGIVNSLSTPLGFCVNATGRLETADLSVELLITEDDDRARKLAQKLHELNSKRQDMTEESVERVLEKIKNEKNKDDKVIFVYDEEIHESIAGIVAGRVREYYNLPTIIMTKGKDMPKGSGRSIEGYNMFEELSKCKEYIDKFGGHPMAAGLSVKKENLPLLKQALLSKCELTDEDIIPVIKIDSPIAIEKIDESLVCDIESLRPFGKGNNGPLLGAKNLEVTRVFFMGKEGRFMKFRFKNSLTGGYIDGINFDKYEPFKEEFIDKYGENRFLKLQDDGYGGFNMDIIYYPGINEFNGKRTIQLNIKAFRL